MDDSELSALLDELGSEGSEDEAAFERTLDDILGEDGDEDELWSPPQQPIKRSEHSDKAKPLTLISPVDKKGAGTHAENAAKEKSAKVQSPEVQEDEALGPKAIVLQTPAHQAAAPKQGLKKSPGSPSGGGVTNFPAEGQNGLSFKQRHDETGHSMDLSPGSPKRQRQESLSPPRSKKEGEQPRGLIVEVDTDESTSGIDTVPTKAAGLCRQQPDGSASFSRSAEPEQLDSKKELVEVAAAKTTTLSPGVSSRTPSREGSDSTPTRTDVRGVDSQRAKYGTRPNLKEEELEKLLEDDTKDGRHKEETPSILEDGYQKGHSAVVADESLKRQPSALEIAEELERVRSTSGAHLEEGAAAQPMQLEGAWTGPPAIGVLRVEQVDTVSAALRADVLRRDQGEPQALGLHPGYIGIGLSRGGILVAPGKPGKDAAHQSHSKAFVLGGGGQSGCTTLDFHVSGELLLAGYGDGSLVLWDVQRQAPARASFGVGPDEHAPGSPITHVRFLAALPDQPRNSRAVTADAKGIVMLHVFSSVPILRRYTVVSQRLLDGSQAIGAVLDLKPLVSFEPAPPLSPPSVHSPQPSPAAHQDGSQRGSFTPRPSFSGGGAQTPPGEKSFGRFDKGLDMGRKVLQDAGLDKSLDMGRKFLFDAVTTATDAGKVIAGAGPMKGVAEDLIEKGLVAMATGSTILVALLAEKMQVLVRIPRPEGVRDGHIPYCAWRKPRHWPAFQSSDTPPEAEPRELSDENRIRRPPLLAVGWDQTVLVCRLGRGALKVLSRWHVPTSEGQKPAGISGLAWLTDDVIGVFTEREEVCVFWVTTGEDIERFMIGVQGGEAAAVSHTHYSTSIGTSSKAFHNSLAARGPALFVLGPSGLTVGRLLHWRERLEGLRQAGDWMGAFHAAMELYDGQAKGVLGVPASRPALHAAIEPTLLSLLSAYIDEAMDYVGVSLGTTKGDVTEPSAGVAQYAGVGGVAIEFCVHIGRPEVLFEDVFDKFTAVGHQGTFLELLEPYILKDTLRGLAPAVMQALVEHYSVKGWLQRVEQCILHMNIASLDFNQVVRLCRQHLLYSALIYVFSSGLDDFVTPLDELLAVARDKHSEHARAFGYKLLVYLKHCFLGLAFPPGNGPLDPARLPSLRSELIRFLSASESPKADGQSGNAGHEEQSNTEDATRFSRLQYLLDLDTEAALQVLATAFPEAGPLGIGPVGSGFRGDPEEVSVLKQQGGSMEGVPDHPSVQAEERQASNDEASTSSPGKSGLHTVGLRLRRRLFKGKLSWRGGDSLSKAAPQSGEALITNEIPETSEAELQTEVENDGEVLVQMVVDALIAICMHRGLTSSAEGMHALLQFCARFVASGHAKVHPETLHWLICQLCSPAHSLAANGRDTSLSEKSRADKSPLSRQATRDQTEALVVALLKGALGLPKPPESLEFFDPQGLLRLTEGLAFWHAAALLHAAQGRFSAALDALLKDRRHAKQTFAFVSKFLREGAAGDKDSESLRTSVLSRLPALVRLDPNSAACIVADHLASDNDRVLTALAPFPDLQFAYLKGIVTAQVAAAVPGVGGPGTSKLGDLLQRAGIEVTDEVAETYVGLMCRFEPGSVLPFLEGHQTYRLEQCLALCRRFGVTDASAYLLERMGDVGAALALVLSQVSSAMAALDAAVALRYSSNAQLLEDEDDQANLSGLPELATAEKALEVAVALCQRNTQRMDSREAEALWFRLVRQYMDPLRSLKEHVAHRAGRGKSSQPNRNIQNKNGVTLQSAANPRAARVLRRVLARFISSILYAMMGHVPLTTILNKILQDHGGDEFGDFKGTILGMLSTFRYERAILGTARDLIEDDTWQSLDQLKRLRSHGLAPSQLTCCVCARALNEKPAPRGGKEAAAEPSISRGKRRHLVTEKLPAVHVYACGHVAHSTCTKVRGPDCPVCDPPGKEEPDKGKRPAEHDVSSPDSGLEILGGVQHSGSSRLALLRELDRGNDIYGSSEALQLAPPPVVHTPSYVERRPGKLPRQAVYSASADVFGSSPGVTYSQPLDAEDLT